MPENKQITDFRIAKMPQSVYNGIGNKGADMLHVITKDENDTNLEVYSKQRADQLLAEKVSGPSSVTANRVAVFNGTTGKVIKDSGYTIAKSVPSNAVFTDTVYTHPTYTAKSSGLYKVTVDSTGHVSAATAVAKSDITGLGIPAQDTTYSDATTSKAGLMSAADKSKLDGITAGANNFTYSHPTHTAYTSGLYKVTVDSLGHVTSATAVAKSDITALGIPGSDTKYTHPSYTAKSSGLYKVTVDSSGHVSAATAVAKSDITALGIPAQDTTYSDFVKSGSGAKAGLVPAPSTTAGTTKYLREDGTWVVPPNTTYSAATTSAAGLMSASDKSKLDGITSGANKYTHPSYTAKSSGLYKVTVDASGHVSAATAVAKSDITALGIPAQDTTYSAATTSAAGLMSASDKSKLNGIATGANKTTVDTALSTTSTNPVQNKIITTALNGKQASGSYVITNGTGVQTIGGGLNIGGTPNAGTGVGRIMITGNTNPLIGIQAINSAGEKLTPYYFQVANDTVFLGPTSTKAMSFDKDGNSVFPATLSVTGAISESGTSLSDKYAPKSHTHNAATTSANGFMSSTDKSKLNGIATGANKYTHPSYTAKSSGFYKVTVDATGHVSAATAVAKADITALGIPAQDTTYSAATTSKAGLMSAADKTKLDSMSAVNITYGTTDLEAGVSSLATGAIYLVYE